MGGKAWWSRPVRPEAGMDAKRANLSGRAQGRTGAKPFDLAQGFVLSFAKDEVAARRDATSALRNHALTGPVRNLCRQFYVRDSLLARRIKLAGRRQSLLPMLFDHAEEMGGVGF
jgi:hypothetical protein